MQSTSNAKVSHVQSTLHVALWHNTSLAPENLQLIAESMGNGYYRHPSADEHNSKLVVEMDGGCGSEYAILNSLCNGRPCS